eukprot:6284209-Amphidinium_carterae.1
MKEWLLQYAPEGSSCTVDFSNRRIQLGYKPKGASIRLERKSYSWEGRGLKSCMSCSLEWLWERSKHTTGASAPWS